MVLVLSVHLSNAQGKLGQTRFQAAKRQICSYFRRFTLEATH
jgi:hypothetical protein